jgi:hypothetical protein
MRSRMLAIVSVLFVLIGAAACGERAREPVAIAATVQAAPPRTASAAAPATSHYEYVFPDEAMYVYDIDHGLRLVQRVNFPGVSGVRGAVASPRTHMLYISHGGDGGGNGNGSLLAYDLVRGRVAWNRSYGRGIDSMAIDASGSRIYMPDGELSSDGTWTVIDARSGRVTGTIAGGTGPHNTVVGLSGKRVYLGGRNSNYLDVASTSTGRIVRRIGPLKSGVRPFTVNGRETVAYTTATGFLGFQVSSVNTGRVLYTATFGPRFHWDPGNFGPSAPSHGVSLSPDERQLWVIDGPNSYVHVFDVSGVPQRAPRAIADIRLTNSLSGDESGCSYDCARDGWLQHSRSGCLVFVGDSGDVFSTVTFRRVAFLPALRNSRKHLEIDWRGGTPVATTSRTGLGYVTRGPLPRSSACR